MKCVVEKVLKHKKKRSLLFIDTLGHFDPKRFHADSSLWHRVVGKTQPCVVSLSALFSLFVLPGLRQFQHRESSVHDLRNRFLGFLCLVIHHGISSPAFVGNCANTIPSMFFSLCTKFNKKNPTPFAMNFDCSQMRNNFHSAFQSTKNIN